MQTYESRDDNPRYVTSIYTMSRAQCFLQLFHHLGYAEHNDSLWPVALWSMNLSPGTCESPRWHLPFAVTQLSVVSADPRQRGVNIQHNVRTLLFLCSGKDGRFLELFLGWRKWLYVTVLIYHDMMEWTPFRQNHILFVIVILWLSPLLDMSHMCSIFITIQFKFIQIMWDSETLSRTLFMDCFSTVLMCIKITELKYFLYDITHVRLHLN